MFINLGTILIPEVNYSWGNGSRGCCVFLFCTSEYGIYTTALNGSATNDAHDVWMKFNTGITANQAYPLSIILNGLNDSALTETFNVFVDSIPNVTVSAPATMPTEYPGVVYACTCYSPTLTASGANSYTWSPSTGLSASTGSSVTAKAGSYTVTGNGCKVAGHDTAKIVVLPTCISDPTTHCFDCDWCDPDISTGIIENNTINNGDISIFPNPNNGTFTVLASVNPNITTLKIQLFNILGQVVYEQNCIATNGFLQQQIQPPTVANGLYFIRVYAGQSVFRQTVVISKN